MGKQINFYMSKDLEVEFFNYLLANGFVLLYGDCNDKELKSLKSIEAIDEKASVLYLHKVEFGDITLEKNCKWELNTTTSSVIEFIRTSIKREKSLIIRGRLWIQSQYYGANSKMIYQNSSLLKTYNSLVKWIKKNIPLQEVPKGEHLMKEYVCTSLLDLAQNGYKLI